MDVAEESSLVRRSERRAWTKLADPADVVQERRGQHDVVAEPQLELCRLSAQRRHADRVLEEASRVAVVPVRGRGGQGAKGLSDGRIANERVDDGGKALVRDFGGEELEEAVELVGIAAKGRGERRGIGILAASTVRT